MNKDLTFIVTVEYTCPNMISKKDLDEYYNGDINLAYKAISDNHHDSAGQFSDIEKVISVRVG